MSPTTFSGASSSSRIGCSRNTCRDIWHTALTSASLIFTSFPCFSDTSRDIIESSSNPLSVLSCILSDYVYFKASSSSH